MAGRYVPEGAVYSDATGDLPPRKSEKTRVKETFEKIAQLKTRELALEREKVSQLYSKKHDFRSNFCSLEEVDLKLCAQRKNERLDLKLQIEKIKNSVAVFKRLLADMKPGPAFVERLKLAMEETESAMLAFKEKQREIYEALLQEERLASQEVTAFERKLETWLSTQQSTAPRLGECAPRPPVQTSASTMPPAVLSFERFLQQSGGRQGGWDDYDHQTFLKIRKQFNGQAGFMDAACRELPTKSLQEVEQHEQWYTEYCTLLESKRKAIQAWKNQKKMGRVKQPSIDEPSGGKGGPTAKEEALAKEREERFSKLSAWKAEQELKRIKAEEEKLRADLEKAKEEDMERKRRLVLKQQVEAYVQVREEARHAQQQLEEARKEEERIQRRLATKEVEQFRKRDLKAAEERRDKKKAREVECLEKEKQLNKLKTAVVVPRDPSRLFKPTAALEERRKAGPGTGNSGMVFSMPRRAIPSWRQGL